MNKHKLHMVLMVSGCVLILGSSFILPKLGIVLGSVGTTVLFLLCPLIHVFMIGSMFKKKDTNVKQLVTESTNNSANLELTNSIDKRI